MPIQIRMMRRSGTTSRAISAAAPPTRRSSPRSSSPRASAVRRRPPDATIEAVAARRSIVEWFDDVAAVDRAALLDPAIEPGAVVDRQIDRPLQQLFKIFTGKVQTTAAQHDSTHTKSLPDQVAERHPAHRQIATMLTRLDCDGAGLDRRIVAGQSLQYLDFEQRDIAHIGLHRIRARAEEVAVALDAAARNEIRVLQLLHFQRFRGCDVNVQEPSAPLGRPVAVTGRKGGRVRSEEHTSELQSLRHLVCRLLLEKKKKKQR